MAISMSKKLKADYMLGIPIFWITASRRVAYGFHQVSQSGKAYGKSLDLKMFNI